ncbi:Pentatricopeptide repeat-containing protein [Platanthera guangdongensis]|uniref:Pentatricopeptide repeat-containing protein n=1 Tax=Platanthera guangdongensis TaxID=2320717 RepID=A0ABR2LRK2_9ASPA
MTGSPWKSTGISPDEITFIAVLCACARAEIWTKERKYFNQMTSLYNLKPNICPLWCLSNLYGGQGSSTRQSKYFWQACRRKQSRGFEWPARTLPISR